MPTATKQLYSLIRRFLRQFVAQKVGPTPVQPNPIQNSPWIEAIHVHL